MVKVLYSRPDALGKPILSISEAVQRGSFYGPDTLKNGPCYASVGDVDAALAAAKHTIRSGKVKIGSQQHFYMECQVRSQPVITTMIFLTPHASACRTDVFCWV